MPTILSRFQNAVQLIAKAVNGDPFTVINEANKTVARIDREGNFYGKNLGVVSAPLTLDVSSGVTNGLIIKGSTVSGSQTAQLFVAYFNGGTLLFGKSGSNALSVQVRDGITLASSASTVKIAGSQVEIDGETVLNGDLSVTGNIIAQNLVHVAGTASYANNIYTITLSEIAALSDMLTVRFKVASDCAAPSLQINSLAAIPLKFDTGDALDCHSGGVYEVSYNSSTGNFIG